MIPDIGVFHPQVVHFVIVLLFVGVLFRLISLSGKLGFTGPAATILVLAGTAAAVIAVKSGTDAHGPAERVPGARAAVVEHEEWGKRTRNIFLVVAALELAALAWTGRRHQKLILAASGLAGVVGLGILYEAAEHGGEVVYVYAGGVGTRSGDPADVGRLLTAGLYHQAMQDRGDGNRGAAARLIDELARRRPDDPSVRLMAIESLLLDRGDAAATLRAARGFSPPPDQQRLVPRLGLIKADAYVALGYPDSARITLETLLREFPDDRRLQEQLEKLR